MAETLEQVLADARGEAAVLRRAGHREQADYVESLCDRIAASTEDYSRFISEADARLRSNKAVDWLRERFPQWQSEGNAEIRGGVRYYRMIVVPKRPDLDAARKAGRQRALGTKAVTK